MIRRLPLILVTFFCIAMALILLYAVVSLAQPVPSPIAYDQDVYLPEVGALCPGDMLVYTNTLTIRRSGGIYFAPVWLTGQGPDARAMVGFALGEMQGRVFDRVPVTFTRRRENRVPPLPPGPAEMRFFATNFKGADAVHHVEFVVKSDCGQ